MYWSKCNVNSNFTFSKVNVKFNLIFIIPLLTFTTKVNICKDVFSCSEFIVKLWSLTFMEHTHKLLQSYHRCKESLLGNMNFGHPRTQNIWYSQVVWLVLVQWTLRKLLWWSVCWLNGKKIIKICIYAIGKVLNI